MHLDFVFSLWIMGLTCFESLNFFFFLVMLVLQHQLIYRTVILIIEKSVIDLYLVRERFLF